jgi:translation elongation factor EF-1alpha
MTPTREDAKMTEQEESGQPVGTVTHYFGKISVGAIELSDVLRVGDTIRIHGHTTDVTMTVESMQVENEAVQEAKSGDVVGIKVPEHVRPGDQVYRLPPAP